MLQLTADPASINSFTNSYHKLRRTNKQPPSEKINLPPINGHLFLSTKFNLKQLREHLREHHNQQQIPIFTFPAWTKIRLEVRIWLKKHLHQKVKEINSGNLITLNPGESINVRTDYFCLSPHLVYTTLIPLERCEMNSASLAVSEQGFTWSAESEQELFEKLQSREFAWDYGILEEGDMVIIGRDCIYGSFRNDSEEPRHYVEMRWVKNEFSSSSSNSS